MSVLERVSRLARAAVFAAVCVVVSAGGHVLAGGAPVTVATLSGAMAAVFALAFVLGGHERGPGVVIAAAAGVQFLLHQWFTSSAPASVVYADHAHTGAPGVGMTAAHLVVAVVSGWWLHRGESAFWLMVRLWGMPPLPKLRRLLAGVIEPPATPAWVVLVAEAQAYRAPELVRAIRRRGPPAPLLSH